MRNLLNFFLKYNHCFLFLLLEIISFALLFRFNNYQAGAFFTSSNRMVGAVYELANNVTGYFHLKTLTMNWWNGMFSWKCSWRTYVQL